MRGASRTMEELRNFWKERAAIEDDYAKRLAKLAKPTLGRDEIGELRNSLDTLRLETDRQASYHTDLANTIRTELENTAASFHAKQLQHKKTFQAGIEREFKNKQAQEGHVNKAREKYEQDCVRINSYTAQASLVQGKDLDKINLKLERAQQTVHANERDFANFSKALQETVYRWEQDWKTFCDSCQDLEEERMNFMKDNVWAYANAVSTVCVQDDESCEKVRIALEQMETEKDMENFVRDYGTGNEIPDPPQFVNYNTPDAIPSSSSRPTFRPAHFTRVSHRERRSFTPPPESEPETPAVNTAGIGAGGGRRDSQFDAPLARQPSQSRRASVVPAQQPPQSNGFTGQSGNRSPAPGPSPSPTGQAVVRQAVNVNRQSYRVPPQDPLAGPPGNGGPAPGPSPSPTTQGVGRQATNPNRQSYRVPPQDPLAEPIDPTAETYIKIGNNAYRADPTNDPQRQSGMYNRANPSSPAKQGSNGAIDPLAKQLENLKNAVSSSGSVRRKSVRRSPPADPKVTQQPSRHQTHDSTGRSSLTPPGAGPSAPQGGPSPRDYRNSAEIVVGVHPSASVPASGSSRPSSPNPPTAAFMVPKPTPSPSGSEVIQEVLTDYHQSLPGERKSISRTNSAASRRISTSTSQPPPAGHGHQQSLSQNLGRPPSTVGHPGIGAHGAGSRSNSPQPPSPAPQQGGRGYSYINVPPGSGPGAVRAPSPNTVGIALDPNGRVLHDDMLQRYQSHSQQQQQQQQQQHQQQRQIPPQQPPPQFAAPPPQQQQQPHYGNMGVANANTNPAQRRTSYMAATPGPAPTIAPPPIQHYGVTPPPPALYQPPLHPQVPTPAPVQAQAQARPSYAQAPPPPIVQPPPPPQQQQQQPMYNPHPNTSYQVPPPQTVAVYQPPAQAHAQGYGQNHQGYYAPPQQQQQQQQQQLRTPAYQQQQYAYRVPSPVAQRTPSPQPPMSQGQMVAPPTGQTTEEGHGILFYVKALYDYTATIDEEFDFQAGDIIAVTATPEDGWWSGELLDEERRQKGRHVFPSNFVCLF
ncbi:putative fes/CIP4 homology domain containing protein [Lyophyllum shimeji]|uniref:Fes/CIP4 homology domain containing protein n=1 Tax=Lyophyllum shimeji TaxID=47721 RepID=A0A9P3PKF4_LYOSH|nr:putative fes/CIP4 homology domain containing protein [Lyophyllum shimeji]